MRQTGVRARLSAEAMELWTCLSDATGSEETNEFSIPRRMLSRFLHRGAAEAQGVIYELHEAGYIRYLGYSVDDDDFYFDMRVLVRACNPEELMGWL